MATAKRLPSGKWRVQASAIVNGRSVRRSFTADTAAEASFHAEQWQKKAQEVASDTSAMTVTEAIDACIEIKSNILSPSTIAGYETIKRNHIKDIADLKLCHLTYPVLQRWVNNLSATVSPKTVSNAYGLVVSVIHMFAPSQTVPKVKLPQKKKPVSSALSQQETATLINGIQGHEIELPVLLALWLGLRRSEIMALEWSDIDFERMTLTVNKALVPCQTGHVLKPPKTTDSERTLGLPIYIAEKMKPLKQERGRVFADMEPNRCTKIFPKLCEQLGLPKYRFHDLRHSMATVGVTLNIADKLVMARGGWNNIKTMKNIYQAVLSDDTETANALYDNYFTNLINAH